MSSKVKHFERWGFPVGILAILSIGIGITLVLIQMGLPFLPKEKVVAVEPAPPVELVSQWAVSPAMATLNDSLNNPPAGWAGAGSILTSPQTPYPFSCATDGINPVISVSKNFNAGGTAIEVLATAYSAGLGAKGMKGKFDKAPGCAGGDAYYTLSNLSGLGVEAYQANVSKTGLNTKTIIWRYGDIVLYLIADINNFNAYNLAMEFQENMLKKLNGVCLADNYEDSELARNPFSGVDYKGFYADKEVNITKLPLPTIPATSQYKTTALPAPDVAVESVDIPVQPEDYPVWPLLPEKVEKPVIPVSPAKDAPFKKNVKIKAEDVKGPGCGWAFTGSKSPVFDLAVATPYNDQEITKGKNELTAASVQWQKDVLKYWEDYSNFNKKIPAWKSYVSQVNGVRDAWAKIAAAWDVYNQEKATYDANVKVRDDFLAAQKDAQTKYDAAVKECVAQDEADKKKLEDEKKAKDEAKPTATAKPTPTASPSPTPTATEKPRVTCPAEKPAILDEKAPDVGAAPVPPADPRPVDKRG